MRSSVAPLVLPAGLIAAALAVFLPVPVDAGARVLQHLLSLAVQVLAAGTSVIFLNQAATGYAPRDPERRVWRLTALAAALWGAGFLLYAVREWIGVIRPFPSASDGFIVAAFLALLFALLGEFRLVNPMLTHRQRLLLAGGGLALWVVVIGRFVWPMVASPIDPLEKSLGIFYASTAALVLPLGLGPAVAFRGGTSGYVWMGVAGGVLCLALASLGFAYLAWYEVYTDVHPINLLRVTGLAVLGASGGWHRRLLEAV